MSAGRPTTAARIAGLWPAVLVLAGLAVIAATVGDYGVAWDESVQARYGELALAYFASGLRDRSYAELWNLRQYGPLFEMLAAVAARLDAGRALEIRHACVALAALAAVLGAARFARLAGDRLAAFFAALALATLPSFYGHAFHNSKDVPFAAAFVWSAVAIVVLVGRPRPRWRDAALAGAALGAALAIRVGGVALFGLVGLALLYRWIAGIGAAPGAGVRERLRAEAAVALRTLAAIALAWALMVAVWPWAHESPLRNPLGALAESAAFPVRLPVLFEGRYLASDALPRRYLVQVLALTLPPALLVLAPLGLAAALGVARSAPRSRPALAASLLGAWILIPLALFAAAPPNVYDGARHFLFLLPALAVLAGLGASSLVRLALARGSLRVGVSIAAVLAFALASPVVDLVRLHPYEMTYFNPLAGGIGQAWKRYETDYWATSYREGMRWIAEHTDPRGRAVVLAAATEYSRACAEQGAAPHLEVRTVWEGGIDGRLPGPLPPGIDYYLATTRVGLAANFPDAPIVHAVGRGGAIFAVIRARGPTPAPATPDPYGASTP